APVLTVNYEYFDQIQADQALAIVHQLEEGQPPRPTRGSRLCTLKEMSIQLAGFADHRPEALGDGPAAEPTLRGNRLAEQYGIAVPGFDPETPIPTQADREAAKAAEHAGAASNKPASDGKPAGDSPQATFDQSGSAASDAAQRPGPVAARNPHYLVVNADEGEPGTCKDLPLMMADPHSLIEGIVICCYAIRANRAFIYVRGEAVHAARRLRRAVLDAKAAGYLGTDILGSGFDLEIVVHSGAGAYICGEETALLDSLEGYRGQPRLRPPFPATHGLYAS